MNQLDSVVEPDLGSRPTSRANRLGFSTRLWWWSGGIVIVQCILNIVVTVSLALALEDLNISVSKYGKALAALVIIGLPFHALYIIILIRGGIWIDLVAIAYWILVLTFGTISVAFRDFPPPFSDCNESKGGCSNEGIFIFCITILNLMAYLFQFFYLHHEVTWLLIIRPTLLFIPQLVRMPFVSWKNRERRVTDQGANVMREDLSLVGWRQQEPGSSQDQGSTFGIYNASRV